MRKAFTLIELIFVIVIIGLLAAIALPKFMSITENAKLKGAAEVANQVVNKATERYELLQDPSIKNAIKQDPDISLFLEKLPVDIDKRFDYDYNDSKFVIFYKKDKDAGHKANTDDNTVDVNGSVCISVDRNATDVNLTANDTIKKYIFFVSDINYSCMADQ